MVKRDPPPPVGGYDGRSGGDEARGRRLHSMESLPHRQAPRSTEIQTYGDLQESQRVKFCPILIPRDTESRNLCTSFSGFAVLSRQNNSGNVYVISMCEKTRAKYCSQSSRLSVSLVSLRCRQMEGRVVILPEMRLSPPPLALSPCPPCLHSGALVSRLVARAGSVSPFTLQQNSRHSQVLKVREFCSKTTECISD